VHIKGAYFGLFNLASALRLNPLAALQCYSSTIVVRMNESLLLHKQYCTGVVFTGGENWGSAYNRGIVLRLPVLARNYSFAIPSILDLGPTQPPISRVPRASPVE